MVENDVPILPIYRGLDVARVDDAAFGLGADDVEPSFRYRAWCRVFGIPRAACCWSGHEGVERRVGDWGPEFTFWPRVIIRLPDVVLEYVGSV
jgi:hypothetical protein